MYIIRHIVRGMFKLLEPVLIVHCNRLGVMSHVIIDNEYKNFNISYLHTNVKLLISNKNM